MDGLESAFNDFIKCLEEECEHLNNAIAIIDEYLNVDTSMRDATESERDGIIEHLDSISKNTGLNFYWV